MVFVVVVFVFVVVFGAIVVVADVFPVVRRLVAFTADFTEALSSFNFFFVL